MKIFNVLRNMNEYQFESCIEIHVAFDTKIVNLLILYLIFLEHDVCFNKI